MPTHSVTNPNFEWFAMRTRRIPLVVALLAVSAIGASAQDAKVCGGPRTMIGSALSVSIAAVGNVTNPQATWTWCFRNETAKTIVSLKYEYSDADGDHTDYFAGSLAAGKAYGGWAAFVSSSRPTHFRIIEIKFAGDEERGSSADVDPLDRATETLGDVARSGFQPLSRTLR